MIVDLFCEIVELVFLCSLELFKAPSETELDILSLDRDWRFLSLSLCADWVTALFFFLCLFVADVIDFDLLLAVELGLPPELTVRLR